MYALSSSAASRGRVALAAVLLSALACSLPTGGSPEAPTEPPPADEPPPVFVPTPTLAPPEPDVSFEGVSFSYDPSIASGVTTQLVPVEERPDDVPFGGGTIPQHYRFEFDGYPHQPYPGSRAFLEIYPLAEFEAGHPEAAARIGKLRDLLASKPSVGAYAVPDVIPFLPLAPYIPAFYAQVEYLDVAGGSGVRCLTMFGFAVQPVTNSDLLYSFQGIVGDGAYYVAAMMPVASPVLYDDLNLVPEDEAMAIMSAQVDWEAYITDVVGQLDAQPPDSFTPDLAALDAMIQSIAIEG